MNYVTSNVQAGRNAWEQISEAGLHNAKMTSESFQFFQWKWLSSKLLVPRDLLKSCLPLTT